jgi:hypothetical protein
MREFTKSVLSCSGQFAKQLDISSNQSELKFSFLEKSCSETE